MLVSLSHRLVILAMPKCASTAMEKALAPHMDVVISNLPAAKHTSARKYIRHLKRYCEGVAGGPVETVCLFREPTAWLKSWWRYRARQNVPNPERSTRDLDFERFVQFYLDGARPPADVGRQSRFVSGPEGNVAVDRLFAYEDLDACVDFLSGRLNTRIELERSNVSPPAHANPNLTQDTLRRLQADLATDFRIHHSLIAQK